MRNRYSFIACLVSGVLILSVAFGQEYFTKQKSKSTISWDVMGYYFYLPATFIYKDLRHLKFKEEIMQKYRPNNTFAEATQIEDGSYVLKYSSGMSWVYFPFFIIGHLLAMLLGYPLDGFSPPYQLSIAIGSLAIALLGVWMARKVLLNYFSDGVVAFTLILLVFGTNYLNYVSFDGAMTHNYLFTLYAFLIHFTRRWYQEQTWKNTIMIGLLVGLAILIRPSEIVAALIPLLWLPEGINKFHAKKSIWGKSYLKLFASIGLVILVGSIQLIYWKWASGQFVFYSYGGEGFTWNGVHLKNCFFSFRKGWLIYTPLMLFAVLGFIPLAGKRLNLFIPMFVFFLINTYIVFSWNTWWYGGSFGQRAMVQSYAILIFPLAAFIEWISKKRLLTSVFGLLFFLMMVLNLHQTYQAHSPGGLDPENMTEAYYWRILGKNKASKRDKLLMDTDEDFLGKPSKLTHIISVDFENKSLKGSFQNKETHSGKRAVILNEKNQYSPAIEVPVNKISGQWLRGGAYFFTPNKERQAWFMTQLQISFLNKNETVKKRKIRVQRIINNNKWTYVWFDVKIPDSIYDKVLISAWNANGKKTIYMDDLKVESFEE